MSSHSLQIKNPKSTFINLSVVASANSDRHSNPRPHRIQRTAHAFVVQNWKKRYIAATDSMGRVSKNPTPPAFQDIQIAKASEAPPQPDENQSVASPSHFLLDAMIRYPTLARGVDLLFANKMKLPKPAEGELLLYVDDDDGNDVLYRYQVSLADFSSYADSTGHRLIIHASSDNLMEPVDRNVWPNGNPWLEIRFTFSDATEADLARTKIFRTSAYDYTNNQWLSHFYHFSHGGIDDATVKVIRHEGDTVVLEISGESEVAGAIRMCASFNRNLSRRPA